MALRNILLIRHVESLEDVNPSLHNIPHGHVVGLTSRGIEQARGLGIQLAKETGGVRYRVYLSPSYRAQETWRILAEGLPPPEVTILEPRIRNLNWGTITPETRPSIEAERYRAGVLNYNFPGGDSTPAYVQDVDAFLSEVLQNRRGFEFPEQVWILTHGFALRVIVRRLLSLSDEDFRWLRNPPNGYLLGLQYESLSDTFVSTAPLLRMSTLE